MANHQLLFFFILLFAVSTGAAQESDTTSTKEKKPLFKRGNKSSTPEQGKLYLIPLPAVSVNPTTGFLYGVAATGGIYLGDPNTTQISSGVMALTHTTKDQLIFAFKTNIFTNENKWVLNGDLRIFKTSQPTYGLGTGPQSSKITDTGIVIDGTPYSKPVDDVQLLKFNWLRIHETAMKQVRPSLFIGPGVHFDAYSKIDDQLLNLDTTGGQLPTITSHYGHNSFIGISSLEYKTVGISANALWDNRDNTIRPYTGIYGLMTFKYFPKAFGSTTDFAQLWLEHRNYFNVSKKNPSHLLALWAYAYLTVTGDTPYLALPAIGYDAFGRSGRAYTQGRFRGQNLMYSEVEYRFPIPILKDNPGLISGVAFVNATTASNGGSELNNIPLFNYVDPAGGVGLRVLINKKTRAHLCIDYAIGMYGGGGFYFNINEAF